MFAEEVASPLTILEPCFSHLIPTKICVLSESARSDLACGTRAPVGIQSGAGFEYGGSHNLLLWMSG